MSNFSASEFLKISIPLADIDLQNRFAEIVHSIDLVSDQYQKSLKQSENLFNSLLQRAFRGKL